MRHAETVLNVIRDRGERGLPLEDIYRQLYNRELYLRAYGRLYSNQGAMTKGTTAETVDGMSLAKIDRIIDDLRYERFRWTPVRRVNIPKPNGKTRPLGIPTWTDKLLQEVIRMIPEAYYEPQFSDRSHGFRPHRGCHTALSEMANTWTGTRWFVEGDIKGCFDNIDHEVLLAVLGEKLHDNRCLRLLKYLLKAGYLEDWEYGRTLSGTPQGGVVSPILCYICLDRLDKFVENVLIPAHTRGTKRSVNLTWNNLRRHAVKARKKGNHTEAAQLRQEAQRLRFSDPFDPNYRRLRYVRYADDFVMGFSGPKENNPSAQNPRNTTEIVQRSSLRPVGPGPVRLTAINAIPLSRTGTIGTQITCRPFVSMKVALTRVVPSIVTDTPWYAGPNTSQILAAQASIWAVHADMAVIISTLLRPRIV